MMPPDDFSEYYKTISNTALVEILENRENYQPLAVAAAKIEFDRRQLSGKEISEAKEPLIEKQAERDKRKEKLKAIEGKVQNIGTTLIDTINPMQNETPSVDKLIRIITILFGGIFIYQIIGNYRLFTLIIAELPKFDVSSFFVFFPLVVLLVAIISFWKRMTLGWLVLSFFLIYTAIGVLWGLLEHFSGKSPGFAVFEKLFPTPSPVTYIGQLFFLVGTMYVLCKPDMRLVYNIDNRKKTAAIVISGCLTIFLMFGVSW